MIILEAMGGLANRMRAIASGIWLAEKLQTKLTVIWNENYELNCPYNLLFQDSKRFSVKQKKRKYNYIKPSNQPTSGKKLYARLVNKLIGVSYFIQEYDFYNLIWKGKLDVYEAAKKHRISYIQTCQEFGENLYAFKYFRPIPPIASKIETVVKNFTSNTIGVHIRRVDNAQSIQFSPVELFIDQMQVELSAQKDTTFFLCTDDLDVEKMIVETFGDKIISYKKELSRGTVKGMQDAMIDLYCLSKTKKIFGSYYSSFSDVAARLGETELEVLKTAS